MIGLSARAWPLAVGLIALVPLAAMAPVASAAPAPVPQHVSVQCDNTHHTVLKIQCPDVDNPWAAFGHYVGHDEPGVWFYSTVPGSGNHVRWSMTMPTDPAPNPVPGASTYSFEQHVAAWFGMPLCATQSYPELVNTCTPDSDTNIVDPKVSPYHSGSAYLELQFYPPGYSLMPTGISCDATHWCAAMNVWSYYRNPLTGQLLNKTCQAQVGGIELDNYAFVTRSGRPTGPPDPLKSTTASFTPNSDVLMLGQNDKVDITIEDSRNGLTVALDDRTSHQRGTMTASAANGFAQMVFAPDPSTQCTSTPYTYHPEYSTSGPLTRTTWTAYPYSIAYSDETGHFDYCSQVNTSGNCTGLEGAAGDQRPADADDTNCFGPADSSLVPIGGCTGENDGFDSPAYLNDWPDGSPNRPTPIRFTSPLTGRNFTINYQKNVLATGIPFIEALAKNPCNVTTQQGCTRLPIRDDGTPAQFYPYFYTTRSDRYGCEWGEGQDIPGVTVNDFGKLDQYGTFNYGTYYTGAKGPVMNTDMFLKVYPTNECRRH